MNDCFANRSMKAPRSSQQLEKTKTHSAASVSCETARAGPRSFAHEELSLLTYNEIVLVKQTPMFGVRSAAWLAALRETRIGGSQEESRPDLLPSTARLHTLPDSLSVKSSVSIHGRHSTLSAWQADAAHSGGASTSTRPTSGYPPV